MEVKFQLTENDCVALSDYVHQQTPHGGRARRRWWGFGAALFLVYAWLETGHPTHGLHAPGRYAAYMAFSLALLAPLHYALLWWLRPTLARLDARIGPKKRMRDPATVAIDREGLSIVTARGRGRLPWRGVQDVGSTWDHLFLLTGGAGGLVIPKRAFASHDAYALFYAALMEYFDAAHRVPPMPPREA